MERNCAAKKGLSTAMAVFFGETSTLMTPTTELGPVDVGTVLENLIQLDRLLDESTRVALGEVNYLELSKHIRVTGQAS